MGLLRVLSGDFLCDGNSRCACCSTFTYELSGRATAEAMRPPANVTKAPATVCLTVPRSPAPKQRQIEVFFCRADGRVTSGLRDMRRRGELLTSARPYITQDTILTTHYSSTGGRKSGSDGAHASATAADAPSRDPTAASRSRAARAGDSTHG